MSGVEAVGLILGVLPLIISAVEHYEDTLRPFVRYRKFSSMLQRFHDELEVERTIFRTECLFLLAGTVDSETAAQMLNDRDHRLWKDNTLHEKFGRQLGTLGFACDSVISQIQLKLDEITAKSDELNAIVSLPTQKERFGDRNWRRRVSQKLKFSFSELGMQRLMADLRKLNKNFQRLSNQVVRLDLQYLCSQKDRSQTENPQKEGQALEQFQMVRKASIHLYESLTRACTTHPEHQAKFGLEAACSAADDDPRSYNIRFKLAFSHADSGHISDPTAQIHYTDMKFTVPVAANPSRGTISATGDILNTIHEKAAERQLINDKGYLDGMMPISRSQPAPRDETAWLEVESVIGESALLKSQMDLCQKQGSAAGSPKIAAVYDPADRLVITSSQDFCARLRTGTCQSMGFPSSTIVGVLEQTTTCRHLIYQPTAPAHVTLTPTPLNQFISQVSSRGQAREIPEFQQLHLAKSLALAVLQFHTTPWLAESWHSDNILISDANRAENGHLGSSSSPYLKVRVAQRQDTVDAPDAIVSAQSMVSIAPNLLLFRLGVMFLELAYGSTFHTLRETQSSERLPADNRVADFLFARQLADEVGESLGADFASIVRKCLRCDFGCGEDLDSPALQARLYEDVVCKLEYYEIGFRNLQSRA